MKKLMMIMLCLLLIMGLASCGAKPTATQLMLQATENTKEYNFDGKIEIEAVEAGISTAMNIGLDGAVDGENMKATLNLGIPYMNLTGEICFIREDMTIYMNIMGAWLKMDLKELASMGMIDVNELETLQNQKMTEDTLRNLGLTFSDVTEKDGAYIFDIGYDKDVWKTMLKDQLALQLSDGTITLPEGYTEDDFVDMVLPVMDSLKITTSINKSDKTLLSMKADFMPLLEAISAIEGLQEEMPMTKFTFEFNVSDVGNVPEINIDSSVSDNAMDFVDFLNTLNTLAY